MLIDKLPAETPFNILIDPSNICNFKCSFCPTGYPEKRREIGVPFGIMKFDLFKKIVSDISDFKEKVKTIHLNKDGEPLLNKDLSRMIKLLKMKRVVEKIQVTTNLSLLNFKMATELLYSGLDVLRVSIAHVNNKGYKDITNTNASYDSIRSKVEFIYNLKSTFETPMKLIAKLNNTGLTDYEKETFKRDFNDIADEIDIWELHNWNLLDFPSYNNKQEKKDRDICQYIFYSMAINHNGVVSVCCADWSMSLPIGDCKKESIVDIWNGSALRSIRKLHINGERENIGLCSKCDYYKNNMDVTEETLLDPFVDRLNIIYR